MRFPAHCLAFLAAAFLGICASRAQDVPVEKLPPATEPQAGTIRGWVVDASGAPLTGATVHIYGTTMAGQNTRFEVNVGKDGRYRQRVPEGIYGVRAEYVVKGADTSYTVAPYPLDGVTAKSHDSAEGVAKDFVWRVFGLRPGQKPGVAGTYNEPGKYYGGSLQVSVYQEGFATQPPFGEGTTLVATLTPTSPRLDGQPGQPREFRRTFTADVRSSSYWYPSDIPLGHYTLKMSLLSADGASKPLTLRKSLDRDPAYKDSVALDVVPSSSSGTALPIQITVHP